MNDIFKDPEQLRNMSPDDVKNMAQNENWQVDTMRQGTHKGQGLVVREVSDEGELTDRMVQYHPGGGHHGPFPYWKVSSAATGTIRIFLTGGK